jgi:uncharacterized protein YjbI with pentapeptide repeats
LRSVARRHAASLVIARIVATVSSSSQAPRSPYPPDVGEEATAVEIEFGDLADVVAADLDWANLRALRFSARRVELRRCRLTGTELAEAAISDVTFHGCRLDLAGLRHAKLERIVFSDCRMSECDLYGASLKDVLFERCELRQATISSATLERVELRECDLTGLRGAEALRTARMPWNDVLANAVLFAAVVGIEIVE